MEAILEHSNHPPHIPQVSFEQLKAWEQGMITLSPDQIVSARYLQDTVMRASVIVPGEVIACKDDLRPAAQFITKREAMLAIA